jgi:hypothetical protein
MEITGLGSVQTLQKISNKESVQGADQMQDRIAISAEAQKRAEWVEALKEMPDLRSEKIALSAELFNNLKSQILHTVAERIMNDL